MKKIFLSLLCSVLAYADPYLLIYHAKNLNTSIFHSAIVETIQDHLKSTIQECMGEAHAMRSTAMYYADGVGFIYHTDLDCSKIDASAMCADLFVMIKEQIKEIDVAVLGALIRKTLSQKLLDATAKERATILNQFEEYCASFDNETKDAFIDALELTIETSGIEVPLQDQENNGRMWIFQPVGLVNDQFVCHATPQEKEIIFTIIHEMGHRSLFSLLKEMSRLHRLGDQIRHVPPLDFLAAIFSHRESVQAMKEIKKSYFKWQNFIDGIADGMKKESCQELDEEKIKAFARLLSKNEKALIDAAHRKKWSEFVSLLF